VDDGATAGREPRERRHGADEESRAREPDAAGAGRVPPEDRDREVAEVDREEIRRDAERPERRARERVSDRTTEVRPRRVGNVRDEAQREENGDCAGGDRLGFAEEVLAGDRCLAPCPRRARRFLRPHHHRPPSAPVYYISMTKGRITGRRSKRLKYRRSARWTSSFTSIGSVRDSGLIAASASRTAPRDTRSGPATISPDCW